MYWGVDAFLCYEICLAVCCTHVALHPTLVVRPFPSLCAITTTTTTAVRMSLWRSPPPPSFAVSPPPSRSATCPFQSFVLAYVFVPSLPCAERRHGTTIDVAVGLAVHAIFVCSSMHLTLLPPLLLGRLHVFAI